MLQASDVKIGDRVRLPICDECFAVVIEKTADGFWAAVKSPVTGEYFGVQMCVYSQDWVRYELDDFVFQCECGSHRRFNFSQTDRR